MTDLVVMLRLVSVVTMLGEEAVRRLAAAKSQTLTKPGDEHVASLGGRLGSKAPCPIHT